MYEVVSKYIALKNTHCFPKNPIVFQHVHFFIPLFWNEKLSLSTCVTKTFICLFQIFNCDKIGWTGREKANVKVVALKQVHEFRKRLTSTGHNGQHLCIL